MPMNRTAALEKIDDIKNQLIEKYKPEKIILFGSSAWGKEDINDIDLFIIKKDVPYYGADRITELYRMMDVDAAVDYIVYKPEEAQERLYLGDPFIKKIYKEGKVLYG
jgi:predicted nucleotidyltransferase